MRSTRASAAWAGIALATSFLSVAIIGMQPHTTATAPVATISRDLPLQVLKRADAADRSVETVRIDR